MRCDASQSSNLSQISEESATFNVPAVVVEQPNSDPLKSPVPNFSSQNLGNARMMTYGRSNEEVRRLSQSLQSMPSRTPEIPASSPAMENPTPFSNVVSNPEPAQVYAPTSQVALMLQATPSPSQASRDVIPPLQNQHSTTQFEQTYPIQDTMVELPTVPSEIPANPFQAIMTYQNEPIVDVMQITPATPAEEEISYNPITSPSTETSELLTNEVQPMYVEQNVPEVQANPMSPERTEFFAEPRPISPSAAEGLYNSPEKIPAMVQSDEPMSGFQLFQIEQDSPAANATVAPAIPVVEQMTHSPIPTPVTNEVPNNENQMMNESVVEESLSPVKAAEQEVPQSPMVVPTLVNAI